MMAANYKPHAWREQFRAAAEERGFEVQDDLQGLPLSVSWENHVWWHHPSGDDFMRAICRRSWDWWIEQEIASLCDERDKAKAA